MTELKTQDAEPRPDGEASRTEHTARAGAQRPQIAWTIAGFDPSSGAGITADLLTFAACGLFGCSAITALTVQSTRGVFGWEPVRADVLTSTIDRLFEDLPPVGIKIGMLATTESALAVAAFLKRMTDQTGRRPLVVLDPVLRSSSGRALYPETGLEILRRDLLPLVDWITPNWAELSLLSGLEVRDMRMAEHACRELAAASGGLCVVATGGDQDQPTDLVVLPDRAAEVVQGRRVETTSTHGTGCAFSSAFLCGLVHGAPPVEAARRAKQYVEEALRQAPRVGAGRGPMALLWPLQQADHGAG